MSDALTTWPRNGVVVIEDEEQGRILVETRGNVSTVTFFAVDTFDPWDQVLRVYPMRAQKPKPRFPVVGDPFKIRALHPETGWLLVDVLRVGAIRHVRFVEHPGR